MLLTDLMTDGAGKAWLRHQGHAWGAAISNTGPVTCSRVGFRALTMLSTF